VLIVLRRRRPLVLIVLRRVLDPEHEDASDVRTVSELLRVKPEAQFEFTVLF
jgi:hypothetical protein